MVLRKSVVAENVLEFEGDGLVSIMHGQTLLDASLHSGIQHLHVCGGKGKCSTCRVMVLEGRENLSPPGAKEKLLNNRLPFLPNIRLACQTTVVENGPVKVKRIIRDDYDIKYFIGNDATQSPQQVGEELEMVLFFLDIRDFTSFAEKHFPFDVIHVIRKLFSSFQNIIEAHHGKIVELMGDGFYAVFECEEDKGRSIRDAVQAGLAILRNLKHLNGTYFQPHFHHTIQIGIGMHVGRVISGEVQLNERTHQFVMGSPVNVASRLQNATKDVNNSFLISDEACSFLPDDFHQHASKYLNLKGIDDQIKVCLIGEPYH